MSILEIELLANRQAAASSSNPEGLTLFPQPKRRNRPEPTPRHWRNEAERNAWLDAFDPNDDGQSPKGYLSGLSLVVWCASGAVSAGRRRTGQALEVLQHKA